MSALPVPSPFVEVDLVRGRVAVGTATWRLQPAGPAGWRLDDGRTLRLPGFAQRTQAVSMAACSDDAQAELRRALRELALGAAGTAGDDDALVLAVSGGAIEAPGFDRCAALLAPDEPAIDGSDALAVDLAVVSRQPSTPAAWRRLQFATPGIEELVEEMLQRLLARGADVAVEAVAGHKVPADAVPGQPQGGLRAQRQASAAAGDQVERALRRAWPTATGLRPAGTVPAPAAAPAVASTASQAPAARTLPAQAAAFAAAPARSAPAAPLTGGHAAAPAQPAAWRQARPVGSDDRTQPAPAAPQPAAGRPHRALGPVVAEQAASTQLRPPLVAQPRATGAPASVALPASRHAAWTVQPTGHAQPISHALPTGLPRIDTTPAPATRAAAAPLPTTLPTSPLDSLARALADECDLRGLAP